VIPYYSLASGFLTGKYRSGDDLSKSPRGETVKRYLNERGFRIPNALDQVAVQYHSTPARIALAWLIARPSITAPIASATDLEQLNDLQSSECNQQLLKRRVCTAGGGWMVRSFLQKTRRLDPHARDK
jgi:aryl-alcohol dehydrogenase-like predicted oxidoreductase